MVYSDAQRARDILNNGGGTFRLDGTPADLTDGYLVSDGQSERTWNLSPNRPVNREVREAQVASAFQHYTREFWGRALITGRYVGAWIDGSTLYLDLSDHIGGANAYYAKAVARDRGELALYDVANGETVYV